MAILTGTAVERVARSRYWRRADAAIMVEAWRRSGERASTFAKQYGIRPRRLTRWARRLSTGHGAVVQFHPVRLVEGETGARPRPEPIEVVIGEDWCVRVPPGFAADDLERVLSVLSRAAPC